MKKWIKALPVVFAAVLLAGLCFLAGCGRNEVQAKEVNDDSAADVVEVEIATSFIPEGIYIGDVNVGGMTVDEAETAVRNYVESMGEQTVMLAANDVVMKTTVTELGFKEDVGATIEEALNYGQTGNILKRYKEQKDLEEEDRVLPLVLTADETQVREFLEEDAGELNVPAVNYGLSRENGEFVIEEGQTGQEINVDESVDIIMNSFQEGWLENSTINLSVNEIEPQGSAEELSLVQDVLGKFSTDYSSSSSARKTNIMVGASCIDGSVIYPGESFSVVAAVTPFDAEHGYEEAPSYENGTTVDTYGGGICQVSTTLYNAIIRAELQIDERHGHSMAVSYVDPSDDAAIAEGTKDLQFTNNTDAPIYISAYTDGATITFTVYGHETRPSNRSVNFESETTGTTEATVEYRASSAAFGTIEQVQSAHTGMTAELWKIVTVDGVEESREIFNTTTYLMSPTVYEVGVSSSSSAAVTAMYNAIASQSLNQIYATISAYSGAGYSSYTDTSSSTTDYSSTDYTGTDTTASTDTTDTSSSADSYTESAGDGGGTTDDATGDTSGG